MIFIKSCPFCDCSDIGREVKFTNNYRYGKPVYITYAKCSLCGCSTRSFSYVLGNEVEEENAQYMAINAWNRRAKESDVDKKATWEVEKDGHYYFAMCTGCGYEIEYHGVVPSTCPNCKSQMEKTPIYFQEENL